MFKSRSMSIGFLLILLLEAATGFSVTEGRIAETGAGDVSPSGTPTEAGPQIALAAAHSTVSWDERFLDLGQFELPLLYLHHEGQGAAPAERTLTVQVSGLQGGDELLLEATSMHVDVTTGEPHRETGRVSLPDRSCTAEDPCTIDWTLSADTMLSDFYALQVKDEAGALLWQNPRPDRPDLVALDTCEGRIDAHTVRTYYATLFPFARGQEDSADRLPPAAVTDFIARQFMPLILETWHTQFSTWGFGPIHPDWDADRVVEIIVTAPPFALFGGTGIYTASYHADGSPYTERRLWWFSSSPAYDVYDSLENGYRVILAHEFYHMVQWNTLLSAGCGMKVWNNLFVEAQAKFAPAVQYPEIEILGQHVAGAGSAYQSAARHLFSQRLNASYADLEADTVERYDWAPYWRFLYEQLGGMEIVRAALEEMACGYDPDIEAALPDVMDAALARVGGPFQTFEESLVAFAEANYALNLENGRCPVENAAECAHRYYDPNRTYKAPSPEAEVTYRGSPVTVEGTIPAGFGMDFVQVHLDRGLGDQPLRIAFQGAGRFSVQLWKLGGNKANTGALALVSDTGSGKDEPLALTPHPTAVAKDGELHVAWIPFLDKLQCDRLVLIIVRLDAAQGTDTAGDYTIALDASTADFPGAA